MPAVFFLPLPDLDGPARPEHLHAAFTSWFDAPGRAWAHRSSAKPYTISPVMVLDERVGVEIRVLTDEAERLLHLAAASAPVVRLGAHRTRVGEPQRTAVASWDELAAAGGSLWRVEFLTPTTFRTGNRCSPMPTPSVILRAPGEAWRAFAPTPIAPLGHAESSMIRVCELDLRTEEAELVLPDGSGARRAEAAPAVLGRLTCCCDDPAIAAKAGPLFRLAPFSGIGSFRGRGMGIVAVESAD